MSKSNLSNYKMILYLFNCYIWQLEIRISEVIINKNEGNIRLAAAVTMNRTITQKIHEMQ